MKTEQPAEKQLFGDSTFREIHKFLREILPPLGFQEAPGGDRGLYCEAKFKRPEVEVTFSQDKRENYYELSAKADPGENGPISDFYVGSAALLSPEARAQTHQRLKDWLNEKPLRAQVRADQTQPAVESLPAGQTSSANPLSVSRSLSALQAHELTLKIGKTLGFSEEDLIANRNGEFPLAQRLKILRKNWWIVIIMVVIIAYTLWMVIPMWFPLGFVDDAICASSLSLGLMLVIFGVMFISAYGARGVAAALLGRKIEQVEGLARLSSGEGGVGKSRRKYHTLVINKAISWDLPGGVYAALEEGLCYRLYYVPRTRYILSLEVLPIQG